MSKGYKVASEKAQPFEIVVPSPAGALSASGADMARFMIAHLQDGRYGDAQILKPETAKLMHARQRGKSPETERDVRSASTRSRATGTGSSATAATPTGSTSDLHLIPDANVGFFVSYNSGGNGKGSGRTLLWEKFLDRYFPYTPPARRALRRREGQAKKVVGQLPGEPARGHQVPPAPLPARADEGRPRRPTTRARSRSPRSPAYNEKPKKWEPIGNGVFREIHGQEKVVFQKDPLGRDEMVTEYPFFDFFRPPAYLDAKLVLPVAIVSLRRHRARVILWPVGRVRAPSLRAGGSSCRPASAGSASGRGWCA